MTKYNAVLLKIGILIFFTILITNTLLINAGRSENLPDFKTSYTSLNMNVKTFEISGKIHINGNSGWVAAKNAGICKGEGTFSDPYVIEDLEIKAMTYGSCIFIENSNVHFRIENCFVYWSGFGSVPEGGHAGIKLSYVQNALLINNKCTSWYGFGIYLINSSNNMIFDNSIDDNEDGIFLKYSDHNVISLNTIKSNFRSGIVLLYSNYNTILGNTVSIHDISGINLDRSNYNLILGNVVNSGWGGDIYLEWSNANTMIGNIANWGERNCVANVVLYNIGNLILYSLIVSIIILTIFKYKTKKKKVRLQ